MGVEPHSVIPYTVLVHAFLVIGFFALVATKLPRNDEEPFGHIISSFA
jgi:hypothetical protein